MRLDRHKSAYTKTCTTADRIELDPIAIDVLVLTGLKCLGMVMCASLVWHSLTLRSANSRATSHLCTHSVENPLSFYNSRTENDMEAILISINFSRQGRKGFRSSRLQILDHQLTVEINNKVSPYRIRTAMVTSVL